MAEESKILEELTSITPTRMASGRVISVPRLSLRGVLLFTKTLKEVLGDIFDFVEKTQQDESDQTMAMIEDQDYITASREIGTPMAEVEETLRLRRLERSQNKIRDNVKSYIVTIAEKLLDKEDLIYLLIATVVRVDGEKVQPEFVADNFYLDTTMWVFEHLIDGELSEDFFAALSRIQRSWTKVKEVHNPTPTNGSTPLSQDSPPNLVTVQGNL